MPWACQLFEQHPAEPLLFRPLGATAYVTYSQLPIGAMWLDGDELCVLLPSRDEWNIDRGRKLNEAKATRQLPQWTRTGALPMVTARPSINSVGRYHGWLTDGVLSDDVDGRHF